MYTATAFSKDNITAALLMIAVTFTSTFCCAQTKQNGKERSTRFIKSSVFQDYLKNYSDKESMIYSEKRFFNLISEDAFLDCKNCDFYIVYVYKAIRDNQLNIYVLKSCDNIVTCSRKTFSSNFPFYYREKGAKELSTSFQMTASTKIVTKEETTTIKQMLDASLKQAKSRIPKYDAPTRRIYYYDGRDYYSLSEYNITSDAMDKIDGVIKNASLFR